MSDCLFCKLIEGKIPSSKVYEDDKTLAFMDVMPQADGHTLVIPKEPAENLFELSPEGAAALMVTTQKVARAVRKAMDAPGIYLMQLNGADAGQTVFHIHFHISPRVAGVSLRPHGGGMADIGQLEAIAVRIRGAM